MNALSPLRAPRTSAGPTITCASNSAIFDTGYDSTSGGTLPAGSPDANWQAAQTEYDTPSGTSPATATALPPSSATWAPAVVGNVAPGQYSNSPYNDAQWISQNYATPNQPAGVSGDYYYRYQFSLDPAVEPSSFSLSMDFLADNDVAEVYVNGTAQSPLTTGLPQTTSNPYNYTGYTTAHAASTTLNNDWVTGQNTLIVEIKSAPPEEAFDAQIRPSVVCPTPSVSVFTTATVSPAADQSQAKVGDQIAYSYLVTNTGSVTLAAVAVNDPAAGSVSCPAPASPGLAPGASVTCTGDTPHTVTASDASAGQVTDSATAIGTDTTGVQSGPSSPSSAIVPVAVGSQTTTTSTPTTPTTTTTTTVSSQPMAPKADLRLTQSVTETAAGNEAYHLVVRDHGPSSATAVTVTDRLPPGVTFVSASPGCVERASVVTCRVKSLAAAGPRSSAAFEVVVRPGSTAAMSTQNTAIVTSHTPDPNERNNQATVKAKKLVPVMELSARASPKTVPDGDSVDYTLTLKNVGTGLLSHATLCDPIPAGTTPVRAPGARVVNGQVCWRVGRLAPGHQIKLPLTLVMAASTLAGPLVDRATATARGIASRQASVTVNVIPGPGSRPDGVTG